MVQHQESQWVWHGMLEVGQWPWLSEGQTSYSRSAVPLRPFLTQNIKIEGIPAPNAAVSFHQSGFCLFEAVLLCSPGEPQPHGNPPDSIS